MGCVASKLEEEEQVVSICRERKHQLKLAVERRFALAEAHCRYFHSLNAVAAAIKLFVARHSQQSSPFFITLPPASCDPPTKVTENFINNPMFLQQMPSEAKHGTIACESSCVSSTASESSEEEREENREEMEEEQTCGYYYMQMPPPPSMPSPQRDLGWDFFYPFESVRTEVIGGYGRNSDEDMRMVREEEGIPELEEEGHREEEGNNVVMVEENGGVEEEDCAVEMVKAVDGSIEEAGEPNGVSVIDTPEEGRELLDALKDIEDHFIKAYDSGKDVSRMLEANRVHLLSGLEEIKENSTKLIQSITWHRSVSFKPSSCKSIMASSAKSSSTWTQFSNDLFDVYGGMDSGSHSLTLGRLYAWEKKLFEEVKAGDSTRKLYERKCSRLKNQDVKGDELNADKTRAVIKDLYARILVAIRSAESISRRIQKLRDEELQPQIVELLKGLTLSGKAMLEFHETQNKILSEVKSFTCPAHEKFCNESHRLATLQLEAELQNWCLCFTEYVSAQRAYVETLHGWLSKFIVPEVEFHSRSKKLATPFQVSGPPLLVICHDWLSSLQKLPDEMVTFALKSFVKDVRALWVLQGEEQQQKRKVDNLAKDLDKRLSSLQKVESRMLTLKLTDHKSEPTTENLDDYVVGKADQVEAFRRKLDIEKEKHNSCMQKTQQTTLNSLQTGFSRVFESLIEFSKTSQKMYSDLMTYSENADKTGNMPYIEGSSEIKGHCSKMNP